MPGDATPPEGVLDDLAYLSRSETRIQVLNVFEGEPHTSRDIAETTDIPRSTLRRTLTELIDREWVERTVDGEYILTPIGDHIAAETERYIGALRAIRALGDAIVWIPRAELDIGLHHFQDANVMRPEPNATSAPSTFATKLLRQATEFACLVNVAPSLGFETAMINGVVDGTLRTNHVITGGELSVLRQDPERASRWQRYVEAGANLYCYDGEIPCNLLVIDDTVLILDREPKAIEGIEITKNVVRSWAHDVIEIHRADSTRLDGEAFRV